MITDARGSRARRAATLLLDLMEKHLPAALLAALVAVFLVQIVFRYFLEPLDWPDELVGFLFLWLVLFGVGYAERRQELIRFSMLYDPATPAARRWMDIVGRSLVVSALALSFWPSWQYVSYMSGRSSWVLPMNMGVVYAPYMIFLLMLILRMGGALLRDLRALLGPGRAP